MVFFGRSAISKEVVVPGYIVPSHGAIHIGYDNKETIKVSLPFEKVESATLISCFD